MPGDTVGTSDVAVEETTAESGEEPEHAAARRQNTTATIGARMRTSYQRRPRSSTVSGIA